MAVSLAEADLQPAKISVGRGREESISFNRRYLLRDGRVTMGARATDVLQLIVRQGMGLVLIGLAIGAAGAFALTRVMSSLLFDVKPADPLTFASVSVLLAAVAFAANYIPARRATRVDPMIALRYE